MTSFFSQDLIWWITIFDLPAISSLFWLIWRTRREHTQALSTIKDLLETRNAQMREALAAFKLEVAKSYASINDMRDLESKLIAHLLRIEYKLDRTAMKTVSLEGGLKK